jgi:hypothetical protein
MKNFFLLCTFVLCMPGFLLADEDHHHEEMTVAQVGTVLVRSS